MNIVFFTQRVEVVESYGERRDCADQRISGFISACGFIPVPLPNNCESVSYTHSKHMAPCPLPELPGLHSLRFSSCNHWWT